MNAQQEKSFSRFIARLVELKIITVNIREVSATADMAVNANKEPNDDTASRDLR